MIRFTFRFIGALTLDRSVYEEVEADRQATWQALAIVVASSVAAGLSAMGSHQFQMTGLVVGTVVGLAAWVAWATITWFVGTHLFPEPQTRADSGELLRTLGFAAAPGVVLAAGVIEPFRLVSFVVSSLWMLAAMVVAVRQALDYTSTTRAIGVCVVGWLLSLAVAVFFSLLLTTVVS